MILDVSAAWLAAVLLCSIRLSAMLLLAPVLQAMRMPLRVRVAFVLALSMALVSGMRLAPAAAPADLPQLMNAAIGEASLGALLGFGLFTAFAAFNFAGNLLDLQMGFNIANLLDPITHAQSPLLATLLGMLAVMLFFAVDAHHALLRGFAWSLERVPLGTSMTSPQPALLAAQFGSLYALGLMLAAPVLFCLFLIEIALAVLSRNLQQMNVFVLGAPIKIGAGLILLALCAGHIGSLAQRIFQSMFQFWEALL